MYVTGLTPSVPSGFMPPTDNINTTAACALVVFLALALLLTFPIVMQRRWEVSLEYGMFATPIGYLIDETGILSSNVAVGGDAILKLASPAEVLVGRLRK